MYWLRWGAAVALVALAGCADRTSILVNVSSPMVIPTDIDRLRIQVIGGSNFFPFIWPYVHLDRVQISGVFGWPQVPPVVSQAALLIAADWFKLKDAPWGVAGIADIGVIRVQSNPWIHEQLRPYCRPRGKVGV